MRREFRVPDIGEGIAEVEILEWHVGLGDEIRADQVVATIQTDKSVVEMPTPLTGAILLLGGEVGELLSVGAVLIAVESEVEHFQVTGVLDDNVPTTPSVASASPAAPRPSSRAKASPSVRRLAVEHGVDLSTLRGTGPEDRVTSDDVLEALRAGAGAPHPSISTPPSNAVTVSSDDEHVPLRGLRRQIARSMSESWRNVPHIIDYRDVDATRLVEARRALREGTCELEGLSYVALFVRATAVALTRHPLMNASFNETAGEYVLHHRIHVGVATATRDGLLVPVVRDADRCSLVELAEEIATLVELARTRKASLDQLTNGTYTVNNLGALGASMGTPIIRVPEVGITGFGRIGDRVVARDGVAVVRPMLTLSVVGDHRLHDGDTLGAFATTLVDLLESPEEFLAHESR